jgi:hypothetical protein
MTREQGTGNREQGTGNREQGRGFGQLYFSLHISLHRLVFSCQLTWGITENNRTYAQVTKQREFQRYFAPSPVKGGDVPWNVSTRVSGYAH